MATLLREIAIAAGSQKLIAGQVADLEAEGRKASREQLRYIHENKTAAILTASVRLGAMSANADSKKLSAITNFGRGLGLAFQIIDDILDVTQTSEMLGKSAGKDIAANAIIAALSVHNQVSAHLNSHPWRAHALLNCRRSSPLQLTPPLTVTRSTSHFCAAAIVLRTRTSTIACWNDAQRSST